MAAEPKPASTSEDTRGQIYKAKSIRITFNSLDDIKAFAKVKNVENTEVSVLLRGAQRIYSTARSKYQKLDEELAYMYYYRFVDIIKIIKKKEEYVKNKGYFNQNYIQEKELKRQKKSARQKLKKLTASLVISYAGRTNQEAT